jgi:hypothetical protein
MEEEMINGRKELLVHISKTIKVLSDAGYVVTAIKGGQESYMLEIKCAYTPERLAQAH